MASVSDTKALGVSGTRGWECPPHLGRRHPVCVQPYVDTPGILSASKDRPPPLSARNSTGWHASSDSHAVASCRTTVRRREGTSSAGLRGKIRRDRTLCGFPGVDPNWSHGHPDDKGRISKDAPLHLRPDRRPRRNRSVTGPTVAGVLEGCFVGCAQDPPTNRRSSVAPRQSHNNLALADIPELVRNLTSQLGYAACRVCRWDHRLRSSWRRVRSPPLDPGFRARKVCSDLQRQPIPR